MLSIVITVIIVIVGMVITLVLWLMIGLTIQGKKVGGNTSTWKAWKEIFHELWDILRGNPWG